MPQFDIRVLAVDMIHYLPPKSRATENIRLIHRGESLAPPARQLKGVARDALDLGFGVDHRVNRRTLRGRAFDLAWPAVIQAASQLTHDDQIYAAQNLTSQGRGPGERRQRAHRANIGEEFQFFAQAEERLLWLLLRIGSANARASNGAEEYSVHSLTERYCRITDRGALRHNRRLPDQRRL